MKIYHACMLAVAGFAVATPLSFAQTSSSGAKPTVPAAGKPPGETGASSGGTSNQYPGGAQKQPTQGLPPGLTPDTGASWNNQSQPTKHE
jgi:hypothetical protein